ncbi:hypothetical protein MRB53_039613 [Persea americana]|nr:hypothetical protein MRB53_039613 [Persea americana]
MSWICSRGHWGALPQRHLPAIDSFGDNLHERVNREIGLLAGPRRSPGSVSASPCIGSSHEHSIRTAVIWFLRHIFPDILSGCIDLEGQAAPLTFESHASKCRLLTVDVSKRLAAMLQNTTSFLSSLPSRKNVDEIDRTAHSSIAAYRLRFYG